MWGRQVSVGPAFEVSAVGLQVQGEVSLEEWTEAGHQLAKLNGSVMWWVGDWACYGAGRFGEMYDAVIATTGYEYQSVANAKWVASRVEFSRRRENLSFGHHAEVAALSASAQREWLKRAEQNGSSNRRSGSARSANRHDLVPQAAEVPTLFHRWTGEIRRSRCGGAVSFGGRLPRE